MVFMTLLNIYFRNNTYIIHKDDKTNRIEYIYYYVKLTKLIA